MHRRQFLAGSAAAFAAAGMPSLLSAEDPGGDVFSEQSLGPYLQGRMTAAVFQRHIGSTFYAELEGGKNARLTLVKTGGLEDLRPSSQTGMGHVTGRAGPIQSALQRPGPGSARSAAGPPACATGFYLDFSISGPLTQQGTYLLDHGQLGHMAVFLVPGVAGTCTAIFTDAPVG